MGMVPSSEKLLCPAGQAAHFQFLFFGIIVFVLNVKVGEVIVTILSMLFVTCGRNVSVSVPQGSL